MTLLCSAQPPRAVLSLHHHIPQTMSTSLDDLTASLSSSHIGQEAIDLAALQVCTLQCISKVT